MLAAAAFGLVIGTAVGLLGAGGSILAIPALVYGLGETVPRAVTMSLFVVGVSAAVGALPRAFAGQIRWSIAGVFAIAGAGSAFGGTAVSGLLPARALLVAFAGLMVVVAIRMLAGKVRPRGACATPAGIDWRRCLPKSIAAGAVVGFLTGLFGVGGGFVIVPALVLLLGLEMKSAIGTSLAIMVINSGAGLAAHLRTTAIDWPLTLAFAGGAVVASLVAARLSSRVDSDRLRRWFAILIAAVAVFMVAEAVVG